MKKLLLIFIGLLLSIGTKAQEPIVPASRLHGDVSIVTFSSQRWSTKFGDIQYGPMNENFITLYFNQKHQLISLNDSVDKKRWFFEYSNDNSAGIPIIDIFCGEQFAGKIKLVRNKGIIIGHLYNSQGDEVKVFAPYNKIDSYSYRFPVYVASFDYEGAELLSIYGFLFVFEITSDQAPSDLVSIRNGNKQIIDQFRYNRYQLSKGKKEKVGSEYTYKYDSKGRLIECFENNHNQFDQCNLSTFQYDGTDNMVKIRNVRCSMYEGKLTKETTGNITFRRITYGNYAGSEIYTRAHFLQEIAKGKKELEDSLRKETLKVEEKKHLEQERTDSIVSYYSALGLYSFCRSESKLRLGITFKPA